MTETRVTRLLQRISRGEARAADELVPLLYAELHDLAAHQLLRERREHTLQPTALVHEAYLKLLQHQNPNWKDRQHFLAFAATTMRRVLVDHARGRKSQKRGGEWKRITLSHAPSKSESEAIDVLDLEEALVRLEKLHPRHARVLELRFYSELNTTEIARLVEVSERTVKNDWKAARTWLQVQLSRG